MTITKRVDLPTVGNTTSGVVNIMEPRHYKSYGDSPEPHVSEVVPNQLETESAPEGEVESEVATEEGGKELSAAEKRAERRGSFKQADAAYKRAIQMQKEAQEKLSKAENFAKLAEKARENPVAVAEALGMDPTEFLRKYQNQIFNIKDDEPQVAPEDQVKQQLEQYKKEREEERKQFEYTQTQIARSNYITGKILPELQKSPDQYEILAFNSMEASAHLIYDIMNKHFQEYNEELSVSEVAEELEKQLTKDFEDKITSTRKLKKLAKYFREEQAEAVAQDETQLAEKKPVKPTTKTLSDKLTNSPTTPALEQSKKNYGHDRQSRLKRVMEKFEK